MSIPEKDKRILWVRANAKCSICRQDLLEDAQNTSQTSIIGENCHIAGEKPTAKRYDFALSDDERNSYPNLILLCRNHHKNIDDDDVTYTVAKLHQIKAAHELWIEGAFKKLSGPDDLYSHLIELMTNKLQLTSWDWLTDHGLRMMLPVDFVDGVNQIVIETMRAVWPQTKASLESEIKNVANRASEYTKHFCSMAYIDTKNMDWWREDKRWKQTWQKNYDEYAQKSDEWHRRCYTFLSDLTVALNKFADEVRRDLKSDYLISYGKFVLNDSQGVWNGCQPAVFFPEKYSDEK